MVEDFGVEIEFARLSQQFLRAAFQFLRVDKTILDKKDNIGKVGIQSTIQFAEGHAVGIGNIDFQIPESTDADITLIASLWQGDETIQRNWFDMDFQFPGDLHDGLMQFAWVHIVAKKININRQARTSKQCQRASAYQDQSRVRRDSLSQCFQNGLDFRVVHAIMPF